VNCLYSSLPEKLFLNYGMMALFQDDNFGRYSFMNIKLKSDFRDFYDHWFAGSWQKGDCEFERYSYAGMSRSEMFCLFEKKGFLTPKHGIINSLSKELNLEDRIVVYLDEFSHRGQNKILCSLKDGLEQYKNFYASQYISGSSGHSLRWLKIGETVFWIDYKSDNWQSNVGDVRISILSKNKATHKEINFFGEYPLLAIDYIPFNSSLYAVDFNISPGLSGFGLEEYISAKKIYEEVEKCF